MEKLNEIFVSTKLDDIVEEIKHKIALRVALKLLEGKFVTDSTNSAWPREDVGGSVTVTFTLSDISEGSPNYKSSDFFNFTIDSTFSEPMLAYKR